MRDVPITCMNIDEAAESSGIGRKQIEEWIFSGVLPAFNVGKGRGKVMIPTDSLIEFLREKAEARDGMPVTSPIMERIRDRRKKGTA